jgi:nicotinate-nucleotide adenylyltransferase
VTTGLFGATFDPPHNGHVALVAAAVEQLGLDRLVILVTANPRYKNVRTDVETRRALAQQAFPDCTIEIEESTSDKTVQRFDGDVIFLIGADQFVDFPRWHDPDAVLEHARLGVATRPGYPPELLEPVRAELSRPERVLFFSIPEWPIASRELRERVARGEPIDELVPPGVAAEIRARGLYRA